MRIYIKKMKFNLIVSELHNEYIHGPSAIHYGHYLTSYICRHSSQESDDEYWSDYDRDGDSNSNSNSDGDSDGDRDGGLIQRKKFEYDIHVDARLMVRLMKSNYQEIKPDKHLFIRNYVNIINKPSYFQPQIAECIYIGDECVAIIKTFWLKIVQRTWKKIYAKRMQLINPTTLFYRQINGPMCLPTLKGMLAT